MIREKQAKFFFLLENLPPFLKRVCFQQPLRSYRIDLITSTVNARKPYGPL